MAGSRSKKSFRMGHSIEPSVKSRIGRIDEKAKTSKREARSGIV